MARGTIAVQYPFLRYIVSPVTFANVPTLCPHSVTSTSITFFSGRKVSSRCAGLSTEDLGECRDTIPQALSEPSSCRVAYGRGSTRFRKQERPCTGQASFGPRTPLEVGLSYGTSLDYQRRNV